MKHARPDTLAAFEPFLRKVREHASLVERTPGSFYRKSSAYLHFHEDPSGIYADVKLNLVEFTRVRATTLREQTHLLSLIAESRRSENAGASSLRLAAQHSSSRSDRSSLDPSHAASTLVSCSPVAGSFSDRRCA